MLCGSFSALKRLLNSQIFCPRRVVTSTDLEQQLAEEIIKCLCSETKSGHASNTEGIRDP